MACRSLPLSAFVLAIQIMLLNKTQTIGSYFSTTNQTKMQQKTEWNGSELNEIGSSLILNFKRFILFVDANIINYRFLPSLYSLTSFVKNCFINKVNKSIGICKNGQKVTYYYKYSKYKTKKHAKWKLSSIELNTIISSRFYFCFCKQIHSFIRREKKCICLSTTIKGDVLYCYSWSFVNKLYLETRIRRFSSIANRHNYSVCLFVCLFVCVCMACVYA